MDDALQMDRILKKANELGHLLNQNEIVRRFRDLSEKLGRDEEARKLMEELIETTQLLEDKERAGKPIEVEEKRRMAELQKKTSESRTLQEFLATQAYYIQILSHVNEAIANPQGEPPRDSGIILPGENDRKIII